MCLRQFFICIFTWIQLEKPYNVIFFFFFTVTLQAVSDNKASTMTSTVLLAAFIIVFFLYPLFNGFSGSMMTLINAFASR